MNLNIKILDFTKEVKGFKIAKCDIKVIYSEDKWEIFRNVGVFHKENKKWMSFPKTKKDIKDEITGEEKTAWLPVYERSPTIASNLLSQVLEKLENEYL